MDVGLSAFGFDENGNAECVVFGSQRTYGKCSGFFDSLVGEAKFYGLMFGYEVFDEQRSLRAAVKIFVAKEVDLNGGREVAREHVGIAAF